MTAVADPYERDDNDVPIVPDIEDVTELDETDSLGAGMYGGEPEEEDADLYTQTVKAPGVEDTQATTSVPSDPVVDPVDANPPEHGFSEDEGTSLGDEDTPVTPVHEEAGGDQLEHGLGTAGDGFTHDATLEESTSFGLGSENTQDTPPVHESNEPDPLRHGLGQADQDTLE